MASRPVGGCGVHLMQEQIAGERAKMGLKVIPFVAAKAQHYKCKDFMGKDSNNYLSSDHVIVSLSVGDHLN